MRTVLHPAAITINEIECHSLFMAYRAHEEEFRRAFNNMDDLELAKRFGDGFKYAREESFVPTSIWIALYFKLAELGLRALKGHKNEILPCEHKAETHIEALKNILGKLYASHN